MCFRKTQRTTPTWGPSVLPCSMSQQDVPRLYLTEALVMSKRFNRNNVFRVGKATGVWR